MRNEIKLFIMDVDGTLTDGKIYMGVDGEEFKVFSIKDGCGIHDILIQSKIRPVIITGRKSKILENRCAELGITELHQGIEKKIDKLKGVLEHVSDESGSVLTYANCAYIGDDINDLSCMKVIKENGGLIGCPSDAVKDVIEIADFVSNKVGGNGAVRDFIEWICC